MVEPVVIEVPRRRSIRGGESFEVFGDGGTGTIDTQTPLTDRPIGFWDGLPRREGHTEGGHLTGLHLDHVIPDGHLAGRHTTADHLWPAAAVTFVTRPLYFGVFRFAVGMVDQTGNRSGQLSAVVSRVVNAAPRPAGELNRGMFDGVTRRMSFTLTPSPDL